MTSILPLVMSRVSVRLGLLRACNSTKRRSGRVGQTQGCTIRARALTLTIRIEQKQEREKEKNPAIAKSLTRIAVRPSWYSAGAQLVSCSEPRYCIIRMREFALVCGRMESLKRDKIYLMSKIAKQGRYAHARDAYLYDV